MPYRFDGKVAVISGAGGGLGFAYAKYLAKHGAKVLINDLGGDTLGMSDQYDSSYATKAANAINAEGQEAIANTDSVAEWSSAQRIIEQAIDAWGRVDIVINNAGITSPAVFPQIEKEEMEAQHAVHVMGTVNLMRAAWPYMMAQKYGRIMNVASASFYGFCPQIPYPAMKGAVIGLSNNLALVGADHNIHTNVIMPVAFSRMSGMLPDGAFRQKMEADCPPEKLCPLVAYLCHGKSKVNGELFSVGGGKFYRSVLAASETVSIDDSIDSVANQIEEVMNDECAFRVVHNAFDDLKYLGFNEEEYEQFRDITATVDAHQVGAEVNAVAIQSVDDMWKLTVKSPVGDQHSQLVLRSEGDTLIGHVINDEYGPSEIIEGGIENDDTLVWKNKLTKPLPMTMVYSLKMDKDKNLRGNVQAKIMGKTAMDSVVTGTLLSVDQAATAREQSPSGPKSKKEEA